ncbi:MAG: GTP-binding protein [Candidatus Sericytochromatia bacterium]|nr:GTP-binding protein [Candidatus Sericytochromatia bacterium]
MTTTLEKVPVTVLTGFLGAGKTTLLNRILTEEHGLRIAVIENEFGEIGIDNQIVINAEEEIFEMNNGCICCTVRGDLIRILGQLMRRKDRFDHIVIETTGLADPAPVAQTFFVDDEMKESLQLDGIVTLVDAHHLSLHLDSDAEALAQVAFADVIVINKTDLVTPDEVDALEARLRGINAVARIERAAHAAIPIEAAIRVGGFDLDRALAIKPTFLEPEWPFEAASVYELAAGRHELVLAAGPDPSIDVLLESLPTASEDALAAVEQAALVRFTADPESVLPGATLKPDAPPLTLDVQAERNVYQIDIPAPGAYVLYSQHGPEEFDLALCGPDGTALAPAFVRAYAPDHEHDESVGSVGLELDAPLDSQKLNAWMGSLLRERGVDIFRSKGVLHIAGQARRFVFQGVHMLFDGRPGEPWGDAPRKSQLVFIGRNLDRQALTEGFLACRA